MKLFIGVSFCLFSACIFAQVQVEKDDRIEALVKIQSAVTPPSTVPQLNGYRLQVTFDSDKAVIDEARAKFIAAFPKVDTYVEFIAPHYFLKVGDFRTQMEAEGVKAAMQAQFPLCFVVKEKINLPRIDQ